MQLTDWLLIEVALLLIGRPKSLMSKTGFDRLGRDQSSFSLSAQRDEGPVRRREVAIYSKLADGG
jgi:hypothetical protein